MPDLPDVLRRGPGRRLTISLDTNDDPAGTWHGVDELLPHVDVLLPNRDEVARPRRRRRTPTRSRPPATLAAAARWSSSRTAPRGAFAVTPDGSVESARRHRREPSSTPPAPATPSTPPSSTPGSAAHPLHAVPAPAPCRPAPGASAPSAAPPASRPETSSTPLPTEHHPESQHDAPHVAREIAGQPESWQRALDLLPTSATPCRAPASGSP